MNLKEIVKVKEEGNKDGVRVEWGEGLFFTIAYSGMSSIRKARAASLERVFEKHVPIERMNSTKFDQAIMEESILSWEGMKVKHLAQILDPSTTEINVSADQLEQDIPCTPENKTFIVTRYNMDFSRFVSSISSEIDTFQKMKQEQTLKNSVSSPTGGGVEE